MKFQWWGTVEPNDAKEVCVAVLDNLNYTWADIKCSTQRYQVYPVCQYRPLTRNRIIINVHY